LSLFETFSNSKLGFSVTGRSLSSFSKCGTHPLFDPNPDLCRRSPYSFVNSLLVLSGRVGLLFSLLPSFRFSKIIHLLNLD